MQAKRFLPEFAHSLQQRFDAAGIPLLLAGGWAVCFHGHSRTTLDVDWICRRSQYDTACGLMQQTRFVQQSEGMASRFKHHADPSIPFVDLIWVDDRTFALMQETSIPSPEPFSVPMLGFRSLLAMKIHALRDDENRDHKDLLDLRKLLRKNPNALSEDELRALCERYGPPDAYQMIRSS